MFPVAGVDTEYFFLGCTTLLKKPRKLLLGTDGYSCKISFKTLSSLRNNGVVVCGLTAHKSHVLIDVGVFGLLKEEITKLLRFFQDRSNSDIFTVGERVCYAYYE